MKKRLLIIACLFLSIAGNAYSAEAQSPQTLNTDVKQKACQNVFSFINIDLSVMSPRAQAADISVTDPTAKVSDPKKGTVVPVANKPESKQITITPKAKTSLFRIDLLHIFKIQIL